MFARLAWLLLLAAVAGCHDAAAPTVPDEVRSAVIRQLAEAGIEVADPLAVAGLFAPADLTSQAAPDWIVDFTRLPDGRLCGTGGCPLQVWVKVGAAPYTLAFERQVLAHEVARHDNSRRWLAVELHGVHCNGTGSDPCHYNFEWRGHADDPAGHFTPASIWGKPARYEGPLVQALPVKAPAGGKVAEALERYRQACLAAGGEADLKEALAWLPDLTRDGKPELLYDPDQALCLRQDEPVPPRCHEDFCRVQLFTDPARPAAWNADAIQYALDFTAASGPRLLLRDPACEADCTERALNWSAHEHRFVPVSP